MMRDRVVCGISDRAVQRRLLQEPKLSFDKALERRRPQKKTLGTVHAMLPRIRIHPLLTR